LSGELPYPPGQISVHLREEDIVVEQPIQHGQLRLKLELQLPAARCALLDAPNCRAGIYPEAVVETALALLGERVGERGQGATRDSLPANS